MRKFILIIHLSLDGFVAGPNGELDAFSPGEDNLNFVNTLMKEADTALFGRNCYRLLEDYWPFRGGHLDATPAQIEFSNWYNAAQKLVVSTTLPPSAAPDATLIAATPEKLLQDIKMLKGKNIMIFGSPTLSQSLLTAGLIDEIWAIVYPQFFGQGLPLFPGLSGNVRLRLLETRQLAGGEVALHYDQFK